jgi:lysozyme
MVIDEDTAEKMLMDDLKVFVYNVNKAVEGYTTLNDYQFGALVSFTFNVGVANLRKSTLLKKVRKNPNDPTIADEFNKWVYAGGKKLMGLVQRRQLEATLYFTKADIDAGYHCNLK